MVNRRIVWIVVALIATWIAIDMSRRVAANWQFTTDDAYITLRYAEHLASGEGITWNPGEEPPVEGYSNFSYVVIGAAVLSVGGDPIVTFKILGILALVGTCVMLFLLARCWLDPIASAVPALVLTHYLGTAYWVTSGLETPVYQFLVVASLAVFSRALREPVPARRGLLIAAALVWLAALTRPEGALVAIALSLALALHVLRATMTWRERATHVAVFALAFGIPYAIYFGWRLGHFERFLPNSVHCKSLFGADSSQLFNAYKTLALPYAVAALAQDWRRPDARIVALLLVPLGYAFVLRGVDPIIGSYNRHALTAWALLLVPAIVGVVNLLRWVRVPERYREWLLLAMAVGWLFWSSLPNPRGLLAAHAAQYSARAEDRDEVGRWLRMHLAPTDAYLIGDCGVIPYVAGGVAIDAYCLNNREMTEPPLRGSLPTLIDRIYELAPRYVIVHSQSKSELRPRTEYGFYPALVADPRFARYEHQTTIGGRGGAFAYWIYRRR